MDFVCLYCCLIKTTAGNCGVCGHARVPIRSWATYKQSPNLVSLSNFNPSTRKVAFDVHVNKATHEIYVVVKVKINFANYAGIRNGPGWVYPPVQWTSTQKTEWLKLFQAAVGLWDGHHQLSCLGVPYTPLFFIEHVSYWAHANVEATASTMTIEKVGATTENRLWTAGVSLLNPYPAMMPAPARGTRPGPNFYTKRVAVKMVVKDSALADNHVDQSHYNPMAHEFGHLLGLPDEYNVYGFLPNVVPMAGPLSPDNEGRPAAFWLQMLHTAGIALPVFGQYGNGLGQVQEHSLMRDVHAIGAGFLRRHYVTILQALNYLTIHNSNSGFHAAWTL